MEQPNRLAQVTRAKVTTDLTIQHYLLYSSVSQKDSKHIDDLLKNVSRNTNPMTFPKGQQRRRVRFASRRMSWQSHIKVAIQRHPAQRQGCHITIHMYASTQSRDAAIKNWTAKAESPIQMGGLRLQQRSIPLLKNEGLDSRL